MAGSGLRDIQGGRQKPAIKDLEEYIRDPQNHLNKFVETITRKVKKAYEESKQFSVERVTSVARENEEIRKRLSMAELNRERYRKERNKLKDEFEKISKEINSRPYSKDEENLRQDHEDLRKMSEQKEKEWDQKMKDSEYSSDQIIREQKQKIEKYEEETKKQVEKIKKLEESIEKNKKGSSDIEELRTKLEKSKRQLNATNDRLHRMSETLQRTRNELDETKTRLSSVMGQKLTDNNPNIADLSDKERPTKLAEKFAELYDNQWSDAYEELQKYHSSGEEIVEILLEILLDVDNFCKLRAKEQLEDSKRVTLCSKSVEREQMTFPENVTKQLKDCRKVVSSISKEYVYEIYMSSLHTKKGKSSRAYLTKTYVKGCMVVCWPMALQDPPVVLREIARHGDDLKTDIYKPYLKSGPYINYVVWPCLLLHENGPLLSKGVAEGFHGRKNAWSENTGRKLLKEKPGLLDSVTASVTTSPTDYMVFKHPSHPQSRFDATAGKTYTIGSHKTNSIEEQYPKYYLLRENEHGLFTSSTNHESESQPSTKDMGTFFFYEDRFKYTEARDILGDNLYRRCKKRADERFDYFSRY